MNVLALCAGVGGIELGVHLAEPASRVVCYVEREAYAAAVLAARIQEGCLAPAPIWSDVTTFDGRPWRGVVDLLTAGFPCQPFSAAGQQRGLEDERWLWPSIARIIGEVEPRNVFLENVPELAIRGLGPVLGSFSEMRFDAVWGVVGCAAVGANHVRNRLWVFAYPHGLWQPQPQRGKQSERRWTGDGLPKALPNTSGARLSARGGGINDASRHRFPMSGR